MIAAMVESRFRAMGTDIHVIVVGGDPSLLDQTHDRIDALERRWSRFIPGSELCRLNDAAGRPSIVSSDTFEVVSRAVEGWRATQGRFDPTILPALENAGYDRDFDAVDRRQSEPMAAEGPTPGCGGVMLDAIVSSITLPPDVRLDLGGIGKGYAADLVLAELLASGATGACVNMGGDLRVDGDAPNAGGWVVGLDEIDSGAVLVLSSGAVATTTRRRRHWQRAGEDMHHLIDPRRGSPSHSGLATVTIVAGEGWWAEVLAKAAFVSGLADATDLLASTGATGLLVDDAGTEHRLPGLEAFLR